MEQAEGGTLFLDEVGELPLPMQAKLLKVIQDGCITRLGDTRARRVDFRLVVATNQDLARSVEAGRFRLDLYYRLNVIPVTLPPLRERREDIPGLVERHLQRLNTRYGRDKIIARDAWQTLMGWEWPGNVRELENWLERAWLSASEDVIRPRQVPGSRKVPSEPRPRRGRRRRPDAAAWPKARRSRARWPAPNATSWPRCVAKRTRPTPSPSASASASPAW